MKTLRIVTDISGDDQSRELLKSGLASHEIVWLPKNKSDDAALTDADVAFGQPAVAGILHASKLRWVHLSSAGYTRYDTPEFRKAMEARGLVITNSSGVYAEPCAEHVFAFMLAQARRLPAALRTGNDFSPAPRHQLRSSSRPLKGQSVVILGYGSIARRLVELLRPFDMKIAAIRRQPKGDEGISIVAPEQLLPALATADHVVNLLPANSESSNFMAVPQFAAMKWGAAFYNIGRGDTVDQDALSAALHSGQLSAAWLDVTNPEPLPPNHPLSNAPNLFITPHVAGGHANEQEMLIRHFLENFDRFVMGSPLVDRVI